MKRTEYYKTVEQYLTLPSVNKSKQTLATYTLALKKFTAFVTDNLDDDTNISTIVIISYQRNLLDSGIKYNTIRHYLICLHKFFEYCIDIELITVNPVNTKYLPDSEPIKYNLLSLDNIKKLLAEEPTQNHRLYYRDYAIIVLLITTGLRNSELRALTVSDLDFIQGSISVQQGKGDKKRVVAFPTIARRVLSNYLESGVRPSNLTDNDALFGTLNGCEYGYTKGDTWKPLSTVALNTMVKRYVKRVTGVDGIHAHLLRHGFTAFADYNGVSMRDIQESLGHSSIRTTEQVYKYVLDKAQSVNNINVAFDNAMII